MAKAILKYSHNGVTTSKTFPNVNPAYVPAYGESISESQAYKIKQAVTALHSLSTNTMVSLAVEVDYDITIVESDSAVAKSSITEVEENGNE